MLKTQRPQKLAQLVLPTSKDFCLLSVLIISIDRDQCLLALMLYSFDWCRRSRDHAISLFVLFDWCQHANLYCSG